MKRLFELMDNLNEILVFVRVVQGGSFSAAARALGLPKSTVSARIAALEGRLGVSLLQRTTRQLHVTEAGRDLFEAAAKAVSDIEAGEALATKGQGVPTGLLRVTAPVDIATSVLPDFLCAYTARYPGVKLDLVLTGRTADLVAEGIDVALRAGRLKDSSLTGKKLGISRFAIFASPAFLRGKKIEVPKDLEKFPCLSFSPYSKGEWQLESGKRSAEIKVGGAVSVDDLSAVKALAMAGHGIALLPIYLVRKEVKTGDLKHVLPEWHSATDDVFLLYPAQKFVQPKVKAFVMEGFEALKAHFTERC